MLAATYTRTGPAIDVMSISRQPDPVAGLGEVLVQVRASGINPADVKRRAGWNGMGMEHPLVIPHTDGAGEIVAVGPGVDPHRIGERVWLWNAQGGYCAAGRAFGSAAEYISIDASQAVRLPDAFDFVAGASLGVPAMTAFRAVCADGPVENQTILVNGAAGAVGHCAVQIAVAGGARVIGTVSSQAAAAHAAQAGAFATIDRNRDDVASRVMDLTHGAGIDRIIEVDFAANMHVDAAILKENGTVAAYSSSSNPQPVLPYYAFQSKGANLRFIQGFAIPAEARRRGEAMISALAVSGKLSIAIAKTYPLAEIAQAHIDVERGGNCGNIVVTI